MGDGKWRITQSATGDRKRSKQIFRLIEGDKTISYNNIYKKQILTLASYLAPQYNLSSNLEFTFISLVLTLLNDRTYSVYPNGLLNAEMKYCKSKKIITYLLTSTCL